MLSQELCRGICCGGSLVLLVADAWSWCWLGMLEILGQFSGVPSVPLSGLKRNTFSAKEEKKNYPNELVEPRSMSLVCQGALNQDC